jgi:hypothetical protein
VQNNDIHVGDFVKVVWNDNNDGKYEGLVRKVERIDDRDDYPYKLKGIHCNFRIEEIKLMKRGSISMDDKNTKYYQVIKDTFIWKQGAILKFNSELGNDGGYEAINDLWDACELNGEWITSNIIEAPENAEFFERVYNVGKQDKLVFATKEKARELARSMFMIDSKK